MDNKAKLIAHENIAIGICLALLGGFLDSYSYLLKGGVFANAQTGNLVLLFISLIEKDLGEIIKYFIPITMFALGILLSEKVKNYSRLDIKNQRIKMVLLFEAIMITLIAVIGNIVSDFIINCIISFIAAVQVANFDRINGSPMATTMITGNLRSSMVNLNSYIKTGKRAYKNRFNSYITVILSFGIGVMIGGLFNSILGNDSILICLLFLLVAYLVLKQEEKNS